MFQKQIINVKSSRFITEVEMERWYVNNEEEKLLWFFYV